jgi:hypothetical protein
LATDLFMITSVRSYNFDRLLLFSYLVIVVVFKYYYPQACISWDTNYYLDASKNIHADIRPIGYGLFINLLYYLRETLNLISTAQFIIYFLAVRYFLRTLRKYYGIDGWVYYLLGLVILLEPSALYFTNTILSDSLFASLSILYIATLIRYVAGQQPKDLIWHGILIYFCIEIRFVALFYAFFSVFIFLLYIKGWQHKKKPIAVALGCFALGWSINVVRNVIEYRTPLFSAFSGWTNANNAMYTLPEVPQTIHSGNKEIDELHSYISSYMDTSSITTERITTDYVWSPASPLNMIRQRLVDSLRAFAPERLSFAKTMFLLAPRYDKWAKYIQLHYPKAFYDRYIIPNSRSLITPDDGEMQDYYLMQQLSDNNWNRYHKGIELMKCREDVYKQYINKVNIKLYHARLICFSIVSLLVLLTGIWMRNDWRRLLHILIFFPVAFYTGMLYTSWFLHRYLLPVYPLMTALLFLGLLVLISKKYRLQTFMKGNAEANMN